MSIRLTCPNPACGKSLEVDDEYAGKKGKCPGCGVEVSIPGGGEPRKSEPPSRAPAGREPATVAPVDDAPRGRPAAHPSEHRRTGPRPAGRSAGYFTKATLALGIAALALLAFSPQMGWVYVSKPPKPTWKGQFDGGFHRPDPPVDEAHVASSVIDNPEAMRAVFYTSLAVALLCFMALAAAQAGPRETGDAAIAAAGSASLAWGVVAGIWQLGQVVKVITRSDLVTVNSKSAVLVPDHMIYPGIGLGAGLFAATAVVILFAVLVIAHGRILWAFTAGFLGSILGLLILILSVKPWEDLAS